MRILFFVKILLSIWILSPAKGICADAIIILPAFESQDVSGQSIEYFEDRAGHLTIEDMVRSDQPWQRSDQRILNFGYSNSAYWFRLTVKNAANRKIRGFLELQYPILDFVDFYVLKDKDIKSSSKSGDMRSFLDREVKIANPVGVFAMEPGDEFQIIFRVQTESSAQIPLALWNDETFWSQKQLPFALQCVYFGFMLAMVIYNFFIYLSHKSVSYLIYVLFVMSYAIFQLSLQGFGMQFLWPNSPIFNEYSLPLAIAATLFFGSLFPIKFLDVRSLSLWNYRLLIGFTYTMVGVALLSFFLTPSFSVRVGLALTIPMVILCITAGLKSWKSGNPLGIYFVAAWTVFLMGTILAVLNKFGILERNLLTESGQQIGSSVEVALLSFALAYRLNLMSKERHDAQREALKAQEDLLLSQQLAHERLTEKNLEIQNINRDLEKIVEYRTRELRAIFNNIPQGVASLNENGIISHNHSKHLKVIFNRQDLTGTSILDAFSRSDLTADNLNRMLHSMKAAIGNDILNFEVNAESFPDEIEMADASGKRFYAMTWGPEVSEDGIVHSIIMTIEDISFKRILEVEKDEQRFKFQMIKELIQCNKAKFEAFSNSSERLLASSESLIQRGGSVDVRILYANAHTIKGGARTLGLSALANVIHEIEETYSALLKGETSLDQDRLLAGVQKVMSVLKTYRDLNADTLGRKNDTSQVMLPRSSVQTFQELLNQLIDGHGTPKLPIERMREIRDSLGPEFARTDREFLEQCFESVSEVARDLKKPAPQWLFQVTNQILPRDLADVLELALVHVIRNAMDHGIEDPEERKRKGKDPVGTIHVHASIEGQKYILRIGDDGRGLSLKSLREKGLRYGVIGESASRQEIAEVIFESGISTSSTVSQISGRGIGMDAVRRFVSDVGGSIAIALKSGEGEHVAFELVLELPWADPLKAMPPGSKVG